MKKNLIKIFIYLIFLILFGILNSQNINSVFNPDNSIFFIPFTFYFAIWFLEMTFITKFKYSILIAITIALLDSLVEGMNYFFIPDYLVYYLSFLIYYFAQIKKSNIKLLFTIIAILFILLFNSIFKENISNLINYNKWNKADFEMIKFTELIVTDSLFKKIVYKMPLDKPCLIDFWSISCPKCMRDRIILDSFANHPKSFNIISFCLTTGDSIKEIEKINSLFKKYDTYLITDRSTKEKLKINSFPTYLIINYDSVIYRGDLKGALMYLNNK